MQPHRSSKGTTLYFGDACKTRSFVVILVAIASIFISGGDADTCQNDDDCSKISETSKTTHYCIEADIGCYCGVPGNDDKPCPEHKPEAPIKSARYGSDITIGGVATGIFTVYLVILPILCCYIVLSVAVVIMLYIYKKGSKDT